MENLFHPESDSLNPDREFQPEGTKQWTYGKYHERLRRLSKVIINLSNKQFEAPAIVGFSEIENKPILEDLIKRAPLRKIPYQLVHYDSPDRRGIDLGLIYRKDILKLHLSKAIPFYCDSIPQYRSRDMLYACFGSSTGDSLHFVFCHWPSRFGGKARSEFKRLCAAVVLQKFCASLKMGPQSSLIIMGDFNDEPQDSSLQWLSRALNLNNLMAQLDSQKGSHRYQGHWAYLDQILVKTQATANIINYGVFYAPFLLEDESRFPGQKPKRAFQGPFFGSGFSDHLPIFLDWHL